FLLAGCGSLTTPKASPTPIPITNILLQNNPNSAPTLTPFQPVAPTATPGPTNTPEPTVTPTIQPSPTLATVVRLGLQKPDGQVNILILGSDYRPNQGYRTDVIMVLSLNPNKGTATLTSFPRDLYVNIPGVGMNRINAAQPYGGFALTAATLKENFDITVDYYIMTNFTGFKGIINTLGGINVNAGAELYDTCDLPQAVDKHCFVPVGNNTMDGATALWYVRSRYTSSDFDRTRRAQEVMSGIFQKTMSLDALNRGTELYNLFVSSVETNLPLDKALQLLPIGSQIVADPNLVRRFAIGAANVTNYIVPTNGAMVLIPDPISIGEIIRQAFYQ
ncbi:MAG: LCP family protein, partial [Ignavibacteria bacterium]|nr:LCP family protein [Ignavibacteria bacterium]